MSWQHFKQAYLIKFWSPVPAVIAAGILSTYYFGITGTFWAVTGEFTRWGIRIGKLLRAIFSRQIRSQQAHQRPLRSPRRRFSQIKL